jgi:hypothetical protein
LLCGAPGGRVLVSDAEWTSVMKLGFPVGGGESEPSPPQPALSKRQATKTRLVPKALFINRVLRRLSNLIQTAVIGFTQKKGPAPCGAEPTSDSATVRLYAQPWGRLREGHSIAISELSMRLPHPWNLSY